MVSVFVDVILEALVGNAHLTETGDAGVVVLGDIILRLLGERLSGIQRLEVRSRLFLPPVRQVYFLSVQFKWVFLFGWVMV